MEEVSLQYVVESNFRELKESFERVEKEIGEIKAQTIKTNGRVNKIEGWKDKMTGAWIVLTAFFLPIAAIVVDLFIKK